MIAIEWTANGDDIDDDCVAEWRGMKAHAEQMDDNCWYASVRRDGKYLMHTSDDDIVPLTSKAARRLCEWVMRAEACQ